MKELLSSISRNQFSNILCCIQYSKYITHIILKIRKGNGKPSSIQNNQVFMIWIFHAYGTRNMHFATEFTLDFFLVFLCIKPAILCTATSLLSDESMSVCSEIPRESISVFSFVIPYLRDQQTFNFQNFSEHIASFKPTTLPFICLYWLKRASKGSL